MIIRANGKEIAVRSIISEKMKRDGHAYPALRFVFEGGVSTEDIETLSCGAFDIVDDNGGVAGTHEGYTTNGGVSVVIGKITEADEKIAELEAQNAELQEAMNVIVGGEA